MAGIFKRPALIGKAPALPVLAAKVNQAAAKAMGPKPPGKGHPGAPAQPAYRAKLQGVKTDRGNFSFKSNRPAPKAF